jgi:hypothetical protein
MGRGNGSKSTVTHVWLSILCLSFLSTLQPALSRAQTTASGTVSGQVVDQQNAVIPGAQILLTDTSTNISLSTTSNEAGRYVFVDVAPGTYNLSVTKQGFKKAVFPAQNVQVGLTLTLDVVLQVGSTVTTVQVSASPGAQLQTTNATVGETITGTPLLDLPDFGRDASAFFILQPNSTPSGQVAGRDSQQVSFRVDGFDNTDDQHGDYDSYTASNGYMGAGTGGNPSGLMPTPVESVEEYKVSTNNGTADSSLSAGAQVEMVTKHGTNQFHGSGYEYYFGSNLGANTWVNNHTPDRFTNTLYTPLPATHQNRFGGTLGGPLTPTVWGGKTYFFVNYEGRRFPNVVTIDRPVPTALLRAGIIQIPNSSGRYVPYNLNPNPVSVNGVQYMPATCGPNATPCDPRGVGLNPIVSQIWNKYMPLPNDPSGGDTHNTQGYLTSLPLPETGNFGLARIDHDFGAKWKFMAQYRYYRFDQYTNNQIDIGGVLPGDTLGVAASKSVKPQIPTFFGVGLTTLITPNLTNDLRFNALRNYFRWASAGGPPQLPGMGGAVEIMGDSSSSLIPMPVDRGDGLARDWDGRDKALRDDLNLLHGNHLFQFGGLYMHQLLTHHRDDNGINIDSSVVYQLNSSSGIAFPSTYVPSTVPANQLSNYESLYASVLGLLAQSQVFYCRTGPQDTLLPPSPTTFIVSNNYFSTTSVYFSDAWKVRPNFTLTYGLAWDLQLPPYEPNGEQPLPVIDGNQFSAVNYLAQRKAAALQGQVYNPLIGFELIRHVNGTGLKYPWAIYYGGFSPRLAAAWSPKFTGPVGKLLPSGKTVIRAGYGRQQGRINGINPVQVILEGTGVGQPVQCLGANISGNCLGTGGVDPSTAWRIGVDGLTAPLPSVTQTLPQPFYPGVGGIAEAGPSWGADPTFRPSFVDQIDFTVQRAISSKLLVEAGYLGARSRHEEQAYNLDSVPYMTTLSGQSFAQAFANLYTQMSSGQAVSSQPFFEAAMGGSTSPYCAGYANCTAAVAAKQKTNILSTSVYNMWGALDGAQGWTLGRTLISSNPGAQASYVPMLVSDGWGNYNSAFLSLRAADWHGLTATSNFTWSHALGTGGEGEGISPYMDNWNPAADYGVQPYDTRFLYNLLMVYKPPVYQGQHGLRGELLGGWSFAPLFTAQSGLPLNVSVGGDCQSFGEGDCSGLSTGNHENAVPIGPIPTGSASEFHVIASGAAGTAGNTTTQLNMFSNPSAVYSNFRRLILGIDTVEGGSGVLRGFGTWNLDFAIMKDVKIRENIGATLSFQFTNVLNHFQPANPSTNFDSPSTFGVITGQANNPRQIEFGLRLFF